MSAPVYTPGIFGYSKRNCRIKENIMATVVSQSELVRRAAAFVAEERAAKPDRPLMDILDEAGMRFNLTPLDAESLRRLFSDEKG